MKTIKTVPGKKQNKNLKNRLTLIVIPLNLLPKKKNQNTIILLFVTNH
jgi:hypothetical protein